MAGRENQETGEYAMSRYYMRKGNRISTMENSEQNPTLFVPVAHVDYDSINKAKAISREQHHKPAQKAGKQSDMRVC